MYESFISVLESFIGQERLLMIQNILKALEYLNYESAWDEISRMFAGEDDLIGSELLGSTETILNAALDDVLGQHSVSVAGTLEVKAKVLDFIITLQNWTDGQALLDILQTYPENTIATFCDLYQYITTESYTTIEPEILAVSSTFIDLVTKLANQTITLESTEVEVDDQSEKRISAVRLFAAAFPDTLGIRAIKNKDIGLGVELDYLIRTYSKEMFFLEPAHPELAAQNVYSLVVCSSVPVEHHVETSKKILDQCFGDEIFKSSVVAMIDTTAMKVKGNG